MFVRKVEFKGEKDVHEWSSEGDELATDIAVDIRRKLDLQNDESEDGTYV